MTTSEMLQELSRQIRRDTLDILLVADPAWLTYAPPGTSNHILWHAGHTMWVVDALCIELLTGRSELPHGWAETFGMNCRPLRETKIWPDRDEVAVLLRQQGQRVLEVLASTTEEQLLQQADPARGPVSIASRIIHGFHDEAKHCGEMYLLMKICRTSQ